MKNIFKKIIVACITFEARMVLRKYKPQIIGVTGSVGKTSTKDAIYTVISPHIHTRKSKKSFNSDIGIPLTILGCDNGWSNPFIWLKTLVEGLLLIITPSTYPKVLVLEVGADRPGDIQKVSKWLHSDIAVFTSIGKTPVHIEFFPHIDDLVNEKAYLVKSLRPSGTLLYTEDDPRVIDVAKQSTAERFSFGFLGGAHYKASHNEIMYTVGGMPTGMQFRIDFEGNSVPLIINNALGKQHIYPILAAVGVARALGMNMVEIGENILGYTPPAGRMHLIPGIKKSVIIDDSYNASPIAVHEALNVLGEIRPNPEQKKIAVLGDMMELGTFSVDEHLAVGKRVAEVANTLVTIGVRARKIAEGALNNGMSEKNIYQFEDSQIAGKFLEGIVDPYDIVLIKGSQMPRTERAVKEIMAEPQRADELLVRQEREWEKR